jgi:hypothetical protein
MALAAQVTRVGFYWPTILNDATILVKQYDLYTTLYQADHYIFSIDIHPMGDGHIRPFSQKHEKQTIHLGGC